MKLIHNQQGLTLIETTVALGIIMIGVLASIVLLLSTFNFVQKNEQEVVVINLAREGIEIVRTLRNNGTITLFNGAYDSKKFIVDNDEASAFDLSHEVIVANINECSECILYYDINGRYTHDSNDTESIFRRMITIENVTSNEKKIISEVSWTHKNKVYNSVLETHLTNWVDTLNIIRLFNQ